MIWFMFLILGVIAAVAIIQGLRTQSPLLVFGASILLIIFGVLLFAQGIEVPTGVHTDITYDVNGMPISFDDNSTYTAYTTTNDVVIQLLAYLTLVIGLVFGGIAYLLYR